MAGSINDAARAPAHPQVMIRPNPVQWIWYAFGGRLRPIHGGWVLHDVTCRTRWLRQAVRAVVQVAVPAVVVWAVLSGLGFGLVALGGIACGVLLAVLYSLAYIDQSAQRRLVKRPGGHAFTDERKRAERGVFGGARAIQRQGSTAETPELDLILERI